MAENNKIYITANELAEMLGVSVGHAYKLIRKLNQELKKEGFLVIAGKVPRRYFEKTLVWFQFVGGGRMKAEKDKKTGKWLIQYRYTDWQGKRRKSTKRGFATKREAEEWLRNFLIVNVNIKMYKKWKIKMYILSVNLPLNSTQKVVSYL